MGAGFVILIWGIVFGFFALVWLGLVTLFIVGYKMKKKWLKWFAGVPAALMLVFGISIGGLIAYGFIHSMNPENVFKDTFGVPPDSSITEIESSMYWFADTGSVYLKFKIQEDVFRKLIPSDLKERNEKKMREEVPGESGAEAPSWWTYTYDSNWLYFLRNDFNSQKPSKKGFYSEVEYFAYDPKTKIAYYRFLGID